MSSLDFLIWLERFRHPVTDAVAVAFSAAGSEVAYMVLLTIIYLCVGHRFGFHLFVVFLLAAFSNGLLKHAFATLRPFKMYADQLHPLYVQSGTGPAFPSGHAQNAATTWGVIAIRQRGRRRQIAAVVMILGIALSRLYCQVHWPADVIGGLCIGGLSVVLYLFVLGAWKSGGRRLEAANGALLVVAVSASMYLAGAGNRVCVTSAGAALGCGLGFILLELRGGYNARAPILTQLVKIVVALAVLLGLRTGAKLILGSGEPADYLRYALIGFTCAYVLPAFFAGFHNWTRRARKSMEMLQEETAERDTR